MKGEETGATSDFPSPSLSRSPSGDLTMRSSCARWYATALLLLCPLLAVAAEAAAERPPKTLTARIHDSGFPEGHDTYNGLSTASDGRIFYVLSTEGYEVGARMFAFDPATQKLEILQCEVEMLRKRLSSLLEERDAAAAKQSAGRKRAGTKRA